MAAVVVQSGGASGDPTADTIIQAGIASGSGLGQAGNTLIAWLVFDNITATTPTITSVSMSTNGAENQGTWTKIASFDSPQAASKGGVRGELWAMTLNSTWNNTARWFNLSASTTCRLGGMIEVSGITGSTRAIVAGTTSVTSATPVVGDLVLGCVGTEANAVPAVDTDTTNGSWTTQLSFATTGGGSAANAGMLLQSKVVTASGSQTFNTTVSDGGTIMVVLAAAQNFTGTVGTSGSGTLTLSGAASFSVFSDDCSSTAAWNYTAGDAFAVAPSGTAIRTTSTGSGGFANTPMSAVYALSDSYFVCDVGAYSFASGQFWFGVDRSGSVYGFSVSNTGNWSTTNLATSTGFTPVGSMRFLALRHQSDTNMLSWYQSANGTTWSFIRQQAPAASVPPGGFTTQYLGVPAGGYLDIEGVNTGYTRLPWEVSLSGSGTLTPVGATPVDLSGSGTLTLAGKPSFTQSVALSGNGNLWPEGGLPAVDLDTVVDGFSDLSQWVTPSYSSAVAVSNGHALLSNNDGVEGYLTHKHLADLSVDGELIFQYDLSYDFNDVELWIGRGPSQLYLYYYGGYARFNAGTPVAAALSGWLKFAWNATAATATGYYSADRTSWTTIGTTAALTTWATYPHEITFYGVANGGTGQVWIDNVNSEPHTGTVALSGGSTGGLRFFTSFGSPIAPGALVEGFSSGTVSTSGPWLPYYLNDFNPVITGGRLTFPVNAGYGEVDYYKTITTADGDVVFQYGNVGPDSTEVLYSGFNVSGGASSGARGYAFASVQSRPSTGVIRWATGIWDASATQYTFAYLNTGVSSGWWKFSQSGTAMTILHSVDRVTWTTVQTGATALSGATDRVFYLAADTLTTVDPWVDNINVAPAESHSGSVALSGSGALTFASVPTPIQTSALTGAGTLTLTGTPSPAGAFAPSGSGTLTTTSVVGTAGALSTAGAGTLTLTGSALYLGTVGLSGAGTLTFAAVPKPTGTLGTSGAGTLTLATVPKPQQSLPLAGTGTLALSSALSTTSGAVATSGTGTVAFSAAKPGTAGTLAGTGTGTLTLAGVVGTAGSVNLSGPGTLSGAAVLAVVGTTTLSGAGVLAPTGSPSITRQLPLAGSGSLTTSVGTLSTTGAAVLAGAGTLSFESTVASQVQLNGVGTLAPTGQPTTAGTATLAGAGALTLSGTVLSSAGFTGTGALTQAGKPAVAGATSTTGAGTLTLAGTAAVSGSMPLGGNGTLTLSGVTKILNTLPLSGTGTLALSSTVATTGALGLSGSGALSGLSAAVTTSGALTLAGAGTLAGVQVGQSASGPVPLSGTGTLSLSASGAGFGTVTLAGSGTLTGTQLAATASGPAALSGTGTLAPSSNPGLTGTAALSSTGTLALVGTPTVAGATVTSGTGTLTTTVVVMTSGSATLSGTGTLAPSGTGSGFAQVTLAGSGTLVPSPVGMAVSGSLVLSGSGSTTVAGQPKTIASVALAGTGALATTGGQGITDTVGTSGTGTLALTGVAHYAGSAAFSGTGALTAESLASSGSDSTTLSGTGTLVLVGSAAVGGQLVLGGIGLLELAAQAFEHFTGTVTFDGTGLLESRIYDNQIDYTIVKVTAPESRLVAAGPFTRLNATAPRNNWTGSAPDNVGRR